MKMALNIVVPVGTIRFVVYNESSDEFCSIELSADNYQRLTVSPGLWKAFKGVGKDNLLLNIASIEHDPNEVVNCDLNQIEYAWS